MKKIMVVTIASMLLLEMGCKKKNADPVPYPQIPNQHDDEVSCLQNKNYFPLTKGSYWIYEESLYDSSSHYRSPTSMDSCFILERDSMVNGKRYAIMATISTNASGTHSWYTLYRYSGDYLFCYTEEEDFKLFSYCKTGEVLYSNLDENPLWNSDYQILSKDSAITVPAGTFDTRATENKYTRTQVNQTNPDDMHRIHNVYYGMNTGLVYDLCPFSGNPNQFLEKRLLRYSIAN